MSGISIPGVYVALLHITNGRRRSKRGSTKLANQKGYENATIDGRRLPLGTGME